MTEEDVKQTIISIVQQELGIKAPYMMPKLPACALAHNIPLLIDQLVQEKKLVEVEYSIPGTGKVKSFLLPKGTVVYINA